MMKVVLITAALLAATGCVSVEWEDGTGEKIKARSPGGVCMTWDPGEGFLLSADPRSDFGIYRMFAWLGNVTGSIFGASTMAELDDRTSPHDTCAFLYENGAKETVDE